MTFDKLSKGSPPPMRGKAARKGVFLPYGRITPAYAGKSSHLCKLFRGRRDHPRLCGEKKQKQIHFMGVAGSPPPMRGKACHWYFNTDISRITPAYAGKSNAGTSAINNRKDHPRLCGEKVSPPHQKLYVAGSPPPMRGKDLYICTN